MIRDVVVHLPVGSQTIRSHANLREESEQMASARDPPRHDQRIQNMGELLKIEFGNAVPSPWRHVEKLRTLQVHGTAIAARRHAPDGHPQTTGLHTLGLHTLPLCMVHRKKITTQHTTRSRSERTSHNVTCQEIRT